MTVGLGDTVGGGWGQSFRSLLFSRIQQCEISCHLHFNRLDSIYLEDAISFYLTSKTVLLISGSEEKHHSIFLWLKRQQAFHNNVYKQGYSHSLESRGRMGLWLGREDEWPNFFIDSLKIVIC